jgi:hypothetical protein
MSNRKLIVAVLVILSVIDLILLWTDGPVFQFHRDAESNFVSST